MNKPACSASFCLAACISAVGCDRPEAFLSTQILPTHMAQFSQFAPIAKPPPPPDVCNTNHLPASIRDRARASALQLIGYVTRIAMSSGQDPEAAIAEACAEIELAVETIIVHSALDIPGPAPDLIWTLYEFRWIFGIDLLEPRDIAPGVDPFPCGADEDAITICATDEPMPVGSYIVVGGTLQDPVPRADPELSHQLGFVFDADGDPSNNYVPDPQFPNDFFQDTDRWFVATYAPDDGWSMEVSDARDGSVVAIPSRARIVIGESTILALIPADEIEAECAGYRLTTFTHRGDFGLEPPHLWAGDAENPVDEPLLTTCE